MKKPNIKDLQNFAKLYFQRDRLLIKWKKMGEIMGMADEENNTIYLNPNIPVDCLGCFVIEVDYKPREKIKMKQGEQYFFVL